MSAHVRTFDCEVYEPEHTTLEVMDLMRRLEIDDLDRRVMVSWLSGYRPDAVFQAAWWAKHMKHGPAGQCEEACPFF